MKIENSSNALGSVLVKDARTSSIKKAPTSQGEDVQLSDLSSQLRSADEGHAFNPARVAEIKQAISEGRFTINAGAIADRLIASAKELVNSQRQA
jgi:negative regulator of flagellin synthesis FlgM